MQHLLLSFLVSVALVATTITVDSSDGDPIEIVITQNQNDPNGNRSPMPISGYVDTATSAVYLFFSSPCGMVNITFSNLSTGDSFGTAVNGMGTVIIPISINAGFWTVTFSLRDNIVYYGEFQI